MATIRIAIMNQGAFTAGQWNAITSNSLALRDLTDAQVARLQAAYPGTNQETAQAVLAKMLKALRADAEHVGANAVKQADETTLVNNQLSFKAAFKNDWPEE